MKITTENTIDKATQYSIEIQSTYDNSIKRNSVDNQNMLSMQAISELTAKLARGSPIDGSLVTRMSNEQILALTHSVLGDIKHSPTPNGYRPTLQTIIPSNQSTPRFMDMRPLTQNMFRTVEISSLPEAPLISPKPEHAQIEAALKLMMERAEYSSPEGSPLLHPPQRPVTSVMDQHWHWALENRPQTAPSPTLPDLI